MSTTSSTKIPHARLDAYIESQTVAGGPVAMRLPTLVRLQNMARDSAWELPRLDRKFIGATFQYLLEYADGILSAIESLLLQASAIDLLAEDCRAELEAYGNFCALRNGIDTTLSFEIETRRDWLRYKREMLGKKPKRRFLGMRRSFARR